MEVFLLVLQQMLTMFTLIVVGYVLKKINVLPENTDKSLSKLQTFAFVPALGLYTQLTKCTVENFKNNSKLILYGFVLVMIAILLAYPVSKLFVRNPSKDQNLEYQRNIYKYAFTFGNFGFMGNFLVLELWGTDMFFKYTMFTFIINILTNTWGLYILIPKDKSVGLLKNLKKGLLTPPMIALLIGMACGLLGISKYVPAFLMKAFDTAGSCMGPAAMILAGFVIASYDFKSLLNNKKVYIITFLRLLVIPTVFVGVLKLIGTSDEILSLALVAFATPLGLNTVVFPSAYGGDTKTGASMAMISHVLSVITIPLMYFIFIVLL